ncbi:MAG: hypothetical protein QOE11_286 [Solirubrobacteraceae bacterium]|jgi:uncharacterized protein (TIGR02611 family)|nr:hypothetical protein [Solirubrobacteraceae bacterium]
MVERLENQRRRHLQRPLALRVLYVIGGFAILLAGVAMLVLPGPAFVVIPIGLAMLSLEYAWAEKLLRRALEQGEIARRKAAETTRAVRVLTAISVALAVAALIGWAVMGDVPLLPV